MRNRDFNDQDQARRYMDACIIRVDEEPVIVNQVTGDGRRMAISYSPVAAPAARADSIHIKDRSVNMDPVPLGFLSYFAGGVYRTFYVSRIPARVWHVGLARGNVALTHVLGQGSADKYLGEVFTSPSMANCIKGKYSGLAQIAKSFKEFTGTIPFSRRFAVNSNGLLVYKTLPEAVGSWGPKAGPKLSENYFYLKEALDQDVH